MIVDSVLQIVNKFIPDNDKKTEVQAELEKELSKVDERITIEANSKDKFVARVRPSVCYAFILYLCASLLTGIIFVINEEAGNRFIDGMTKHLASIPEDMWSTFLWIILGYTGARSFDKYKKK